ncbi:hypothetical protein ACWIGD_08630 [Streptomyces albidoflavus]
MRVHHLNCGSLRKIPPLGGERPGGAEAGGLPDFPGARVHVHPAEYRAVTGPADPHHRHSLDRFLPAHRAHGPLLTPAVADGSAEWFGFPGMARVPGLACEVLLVPLPGHSAGPAGVAVRGGDGRWLLHAGGAYRYHGETERARRRPTPPSPRSSRGRRPAPRPSGPRASGCAPHDHGDRVTVFSAHDPWEWARLTTPMPLPAPAHPGD